MPPSLLGGEKEIDALSEPVAVAITFNGGDGFTLGIIEFEAYDGLDDPIELVATTVKV